MTHSVTYSELGETTNATIEFTCSYNGGYYLTTDLELKGRGIKKMSNGENHKRNKKTYKATERALNLLKEKYTSSFMANL